MAHSITAIILQGSFDAAAAAEFDLLGTPLGHGLTLFHITHYYSACWQKTLGVEGEMGGAVSGSLIFPRERVLAVLMERITGREPVFAVIATDYSGGMGGQWAQLYRGSTAIAPDVTDINAVLRWLGVSAKAGMDEFQTVGLHRIRRSPESLDRYVDLAEQLGV